MSHLLLHPPPDHGPLEGPSTQAPVGGHEEQQPLRVPVTLAQFKDRLTARNIIASMAIEEDHPLKSMPQHILRKAHEQV